MNTYQTSILSNIKQVYKRRLFSPAIYLILLLLVWIITPVSELILPVQITDEAQISTLYYQKRTHYVNITLQNLHFTGYTQTAFGTTNGYYYYTICDGECILVLLSPKTCEEGLPDIEEVTIHAQLLQNSKAFSQLISKLAKDLSWSDTSLRTKVSSCIVSEPGFGMTFTNLLVSFYMLSGIYSMVSIILCIAYIIWPVLSPTCRDLGLYGNAKKLLEQAEQELATLPQLATEDMYITEHFFIAFASHRVAVVPIGEIIWIYKHSTLHKFLWYHFSISYTLHITARKHLYLQCPKNMKSDIDGIIDYLSEANHDIVVGFSEENRLKVQEMLGVSIYLKRLLSFFSRKIAE